MRPGMDRGKPGQDRRGTSRVSKPAESSTKRVQAVSKPATGRINTQGSGTSRREAQEQRQAQSAPAQDSSKNTLYIALGGGALVVVLILAFMLSGGESEGRSGGSYENTMKSAINRSQEAYQKGEYHQALDIAEEALKDPRSRKTSRYNALNSLATMARTQVNLDRDARDKVAEFKKRVDAAVADQTAMAKAKGFWDECLTLEGQFSGTTSKKAIKDIKEDLRRWVATESQGDWQKDYNLTKGRIEKSHLSSQNYSEAIREWQRFGESSQDPLLRSRIEQEIRTINQGAVASAEKLVAEAGGGADARTKLEESQQKFNGTDGQAVINKAMRSLK